MKKIIKKFVVGNQEVRVYRDPEWNEYIVRVATDGKLDPHTDGYFTSDKDDAIYTARHMVGKAGSR